MDVLYDTQHQNVLHVLLDTTRMSKAIPPAESAQQITQLSLVVPGYKVTVLSYALLEISLKME